MDDDDDMSELYLTRKLDGLSSPSSDNGVHTWLSASPTLGSKRSRASATTHGGSDVEELEMLLEVVDFSVVICVVDYTKYAEVLNDSCFAGLLHTSGRHIKQTDYGNKNQLNPNKAVVIIYSSCIISNIYLTN